MNSLKYLLVWSDIFQRLSRVSNALDTLYIGEGILEIYLHWMHISSMPVWLLSDDCPQCWWILLWPCKFKEREAENLALASVFVYPKDCLEPDWQLPFWNLVVELLTRLFEILKDSLAFFILSSRFSPKRYFESDDNSLSHNLLALREDIGHKHSLHSADFYFICWYLIFKTSRILFTTTGFFESSDQYFIATSANWLNIASPNSSSFTFYLFISSNIPKSFAALFSLPDWSRFSASSTSKLMSLSNIFLNALKCFFDVTVSPSTRGLIDFKLGSIDWETSQISYITFSS